MLNTFCPALANLLIHFDKIVPCPSACSELLTALSSCSPVCALILPTSSIIHLVQSICAGMEVRKLPNEWKLLHENVPIIYNLICNHNETSLPPEYRQVVNEMLLKAQLPFLKTEKHSLIPVPTAAFENSYEYFPSLKKYCSRPTYMSDKRCESYMCSKTYRGHPSLLPGIFTLFCPHG